MPTIAEDVGGEDRGTKTGNSVESVDAKDNGHGLQGKEVSGSTEASPIKMAVINEN